MLLEIVTIWEDAFISVASKLSQCRYNERVKAFPQTTVIIFLLQSGNKNISPDDCSIFLLQWQKYFPRRLLQSPWWNDKDIVTVVWGNAFVIVAETLWQSSGEIPLSLTLYQGHSNNRLGAFVIVARPCDVVWGFFVIVASMGYRLRKYFCHCSRDIVTVVWGNTFVIVARTCDVVCGNAFVVVARTF